MLPMIVVVISITNIMEKQIVNQWTCIGMASVDDNVEFRVTLGTATFVIAATWITMAAVNEKNIV